MIIWSEHKYWVFKIREGFWRNVSISGSLQRLYKTDSVTKGSVGKIHNFCRRLITALEVFWREAFVPWSFSDNLSNTGFQSGKGIFTLSEFTCTQMGTCLCNTCCYKKCKEEGKKTYLKWKSVSISQKQLERSLECLIINFANEWKSTQAE